MAQHAPLRHDRREIVEREHRVHARQRAHVTRIDAADQGVRMRAAHERRVQQPGQLDVVDEASAADEQRAVLETGNARSDQAAHRPAAQSDSALAARAMTSLGVA